MSSMLGTLATVAATPVSVTFSGGIGQIDDKYAILDTIVMSDKTEGEGLYRRLLRRWTNPLYLRTSPEA